MKTGTWIFGLICFACLMMLSGCVNSASSEPSVQSPKATKSSSAEFPTGKNLNRLFQLADLEKINVDLGGKSFELFVMDDDEKRREGMMFLEDAEVRDDQGMIFIFQDVQKKDDEHGFWMKNTVLPLDIIYVSKEKRIVSIGEGVPFKEEIVAPKGDYQYVIELKKGQANELGLQPGDQLDFAG